jgi:catechol 2,3-dioxygenase-like lactoylglutathione lyase family enzyme
MTTKATFAAGRNIAIKVPVHQYDATVRFYRDVLGLAEFATQAGSVSFEFGPNRLWIDRAPTMSQAETWLEIVTNDLATAADDLAAAGVVRCDDIEPLPAGMRAFWITSPASIVHLVCQDSE